MIAPGATIGIFGGGQLGRMLALAARPLGYHVVVLDPDPECAARPVVDGCVTAAFDDVAGAVELAHSCAAVTLEIEKVSPGSLRAVEARVPLRPGSTVVEMVQDRATQKRWLSAHGFPVGAYREVESIEELAASALELGGRCFVKAARGGYDGRGQVELASPGEAAKAWAALGASLCVAEQALDLQLELSVLVARRPSGELAVYPPALNHHEKRVLAWSTLPGIEDAALAGRAQELASSIARDLGLEGLLAVEMFVTTRGELLVNELAPRPHNSYHASEIACATSQFEQGIRALCDLPLGSTEIVRPGAIVNLLGDLWLGGSSPDFAAALAVANVHLHLYGKGVPKPGRKMGHLSASGATPAEALARARAAYAALSGARA